MKDSCSTCSLPAAVTAALAALPPRQELVQACRQQMAFLQRAHRCGVTTRFRADCREEDLWKSALHRYRHLWLPLVAQYPSHVLIPPPDVAWLWQAHRLAPRRYQDYCRDNFDNHVLTAQAPFALQEEENDVYPRARAAWVTRLLWKRAYPDAAFFVSKRALAHQTTAHTDNDDSALSILLLDSVRAQAAFLWHISSGPQWQADAFLHQAVTRYAGFLTLARHASSDLPLVPTYDIDLVWHVHILLGVSEYFAATQQIGGRPLNHDDSFHDRQGQGPASYQRAWQATCDLYRIHIGRDDYATIPGTLYYGEPLEGYWEYAQWDPHGPWRPSRPWSQRLRQTFGRAHSVRKSPRITWSTLQQVRGSELWKVRQQLVAAHASSSSTSSSSNNNTRVMDIPVATHSWRFRLAHPLAKSVKVRLVGSMHAFADMEQTKGMEKSALPDGIPQALTQTTGQEWQRQRSLVAKRALASVKEQSLRAVTKIRWTELLDKEASSCGLSIINPTSTTTTSSGSPTIIVDLKGMIVKAVLTWSTHLFGGTTPGEEFDTPRTALSSRFDAFWQAIRAYEKDGERLQQTRQNLGQAIRQVAAMHAKPSRDTDGLIAHLFAQDLTLAQASLNAIHAMVAASDTTFCLVFWTLVNLAQTVDAWEECQAIHWTVDAIEREQTLMGELKARATAGDLLDSSGLSLLGRALFETARVFPPVWSLPRVLPNGSHVKLDVPWTNGADSPTDWNPRAPSFALATFGAGQRHCPGGTAALYAAHAMLRGLMEQCAAPRECEPGHALKSLYLGPTLCVDGPQYFVFTKRESTTTGSATS